MKNLTMLGAERLEMTLARERDEGKLPLSVPEIPENLKSALGFDTSSPAVRRAFRKAWLAFRKYERRQARTRRGRIMVDGERRSVEPRPEAHNFDGKTRNYRSLVVADWLLWKMCPVNDRPPGWPTSEKQLASMHRLSEDGLTSLVVRIQGQMILASMFMPFDAEDLNRRADRLLTQTLAEQEKLPAEERDPRWVDVAYKRSGAVSKAATFNKTQINVQGNMTQNVLQLTPEERKAAEERLKLHAARHFREVPIEEAPLELPERPDGEQRGSAAVEQTKHGDDPHAA